MKSIDKSRDFRILIFFIFSFFDTQTYIQILSKITKRQVLQYSEFWLNEIFSIRVYISFMTPRGSKYKMFTFMLKAAFEIFFYSLGTIVVKSLLPFLTRQNLASRHVSIRFLRIGSFTKSLLFQDCKFIQ